MFIFSLNQGISKYYTTQVAPTRVETLREIAKSAKYEIGPQIPGDAKSPKSRSERVLTGGAESEMNEWIHGERITCCGPISYLTDFAISRRVSTQVGATCIV